MRRTEKRIGPGDVLLLAVSLLFTLGILFAFGPCGPKEDGSWMTCHWAGQTAAGAAVLLLVLSVVHLAVRDRGAKLGLDLALAVTAVYAALLPGRLIDLCMMPDMRCRRVMAPAVTVFAVLTILCAGADALLRRRGGNAS